MTISILIVSFGFPVREEGCELNLASCDLNRDNRVRVSYRVDNNKDGGAFIDDEDAPYGDVYRDIHRDFYDRDFYAFYNRCDDRDSYAFYEDDRVGDRG